jgi:hypothetical protein
MMTVPDRRERLLHMRGVGRVRVARGGEVCIADEGEAVLVAASQELVLKHRLAQVLQEPWPCDGGVM